VLDGAPALRDRQGAKKRRLIVECDEWWSLVGNKQQPQWSWLTLDRDTRESVGVAIGTRDEATACALMRA
jgi:insertion element IS1 protein InsB